MINQVYITESEHGASRTSIPLFSKFRNKISIVVESTKFENLQK